MNKGCVLGLAAAVLAALPVCGAWEAIEDFEAYASGAAAPFSPTFGGSDASRTVVAGADGMAGQVDNSSGASGGHVYEFDTHPALADAGTTEVTFFFQVQWDATGSDTFFSLSGDGIAAYGDLNIVFRVPSDLILEVYNGSSSYQDTGVTMVLNTVYNFWVVVNNVAKTWELYVSTGEDDGSAVTVGSTTTFGFRNSGGAVIDTLYLGANGSSKYRIDNLFMDPDGSNTSVAEEEEPPAGPTLHLIAITPQ